ncbi:vascular endothelial growth factor A [Trichomycterus rosablanca]|uniref:vascular endothelial growth factor A n=1 Tax=Trichomycterus rosablanca TaxID=2290929 RepID=UPI002F35EA79
MCTLIWLIQILSLLLPYKPFTQVSAHLGTNHSKVMLFHDVWLRSMCQSLEKMVEVEKEYPGSVEHIFSPGCVPLHRCSGCCNDEKLKCSPILTHNVTMQLVRITPVHRTKQYVQLSFLEHQRCECRCKDHFSFLGQMQADSSEMKKMKTLKYLQEKTWLSTSCLGSVE